MGRVPSESRAPSRRNASQRGVQELRAHALHVGHLIGVMSSLPIGVKSDNRAGSGELLLPFCMLRGGQPGLKRFRCFA